MKTAVLGVGRMGRRHIQVTCDLGLELVGVCDQSSESLKIAAEEFTIPSERCFTQPSELFLREHPECVIIATTAPAHCEYTCLAAEAGVKYILCEKPMGVSLAECDQMISACQTYGARLAVNHQMRFMEQYVKTKEIVRTEAFGGLSSVTVVAGNMGMAMNGTHYFEMFRYMTDEQPQTVTAWFSNEDVPNPRGAQFHDRAGAVRVTTATGKRFYMEIGTDQGHGLKVIYAGPNGTMVVDELSGTIETNIREQQYRDLPTTRYGMPSTYESSKIAPADAVAPSRAVLKALLNDEGPPSGADGRLAVAVLIAAYVSNDNGHVPINVDDNLPSERVFPWA